MPAAGVSAFATVILIALVMMFGRATNNPKLSDWSKTEVVQLPITVASILVIMLFINAFCAIDMNSLRSLFGKPELPPPPHVTGYPDSQYYNVFDSAESYLVQSAGFAREAMVVARYHHSVYNIFLMRNTYRCDGWCLFGNSGITYQGFAGYAGRLNMMGMLFNTALTSYLSALNSLFIFLFVKNGFFLTLLPMGIMVRSLPFFRTFGSVLIAVAMSFFVIYPATLAVFSMMDGIFVSPFAGIDACGHMDLKAYFMNEANIYSRDRDIPDVGGGDLDDGDLARVYLPCGVDYPIQVAQYAAYSFIAAVFLPTVALLGAVASVRYLAKMYGEEIDLSRIVQMV